MQRANEMIAEASYRPMSEAAMHYFIPASALVPIECRCECHGVAR